MLPLPETSCSEVKVSHRLSLGLLARTSIRDEACQGLGSHMIEYDNR